MRPLRRGGVNKRRSAGGFRRNVSRTNVRMPEYGDFTGVFDFHSAMNAVAMANESFEAMPADVRARFHNDPQEFVSFCMDDKNMDEARKLGLVPAKEVEKAAELTGAGAGAPAGEVLPVAAATVVAKP